MNHFQMDRLDQCRKGMCQEAWSIYIDALKILDQKVETGLKSSASTKHNQKKNDFIPIGSEKGQKWEVKRSEIAGIETNKNSSDLLQLTRFAVADFNKVGAHSFFIESKSRYNSYGVYQILVQKVLTKDTSKNRYAGKSVSIRSEIKEHFL